MLNFHEVEANLRESFRALAAGRTNGRTLELPGVTIASLGVTFQMFNAAFLNAPVSGQKDLETRLALARDHFQSERRAWAFWVCEDWLDRQARRYLAGSCERFGLRLASELPGMVAEGLAPTQRPLPQLDVRRVNSDRTLNDFRAIGSVCFHVPLAWFSEVFDASIPPGFACWVGYLEDQPVATAASVPSDGVIGLYNIATAPGLRRRGIAEAMTRRVTPTGPPIVLQSTSMGMRLYERLGFRTVTRILVFNS